MQNVRFRDIGLIDYKEAWDFQEILFQELIARKIKNRSLPVSEQELQDHYLIFCEHPHVFTLGRSGEEKNLLVNSVQLKGIQASFYKNNRGGDITYHGPGQIVILRFRSHVLKGHPDDEVTDRRVEGGIHV